MTSHHNHFHVVEKDASPYALKEGTLAPLPGMAEHCDIGTAFDAAQNLPREPISAPEDASTRAPEAHPHEHHENALEHLIHAIVDGVTGHHHPHHATEEGHNQTPDGSQAGHKEEHKPKPEIGTPLQTEIMRAL